jgi:dTDP-4-amino-4,6-dideoxygalactose transaminase
LQPYQVLEQRLAQWVCGPNVAVCSSGSAALHLALEALDLPRGSEVIVPTWSFIACARAVTLAGLEPVFVDCQEDGTMNVEQIGEAHRSGAMPGDRRGVSAVMVVHPNGRRIDMRLVGKMRDTYSHLRVVEDMAQLHGFKRSRWTDAACWSFNRSKVVAGEEGGAVAFSEDREGQLRCRVVQSLRSQGTVLQETCGQWHHQAGGMNYRLANALAIPIIASLAQYDNSAMARWKSWHEINSLCPLERRMPWPSVPWVYDFRVPGMTEDRQRQAVAALEELGIAARQGYRPLHLQSEYQGCRRVGGQVAEMLAREVIALPLPIRSEVVGLAWDAVRKLL